jgi:hypothetical protein
MYKVVNVKTLNWLNSSTNYLILINPEKIPHLGLIKDGQYFSLTYKKAQLNEPFKPYFNYLKRSGRTMLFLELKSNLLDVEEIFDRYDKAVVGKTTCLHPIREALLPGSQADFIYELLPALEQAGLIGKAFHVNMDEFLDERLDFTLSTYDKESIYSYIETLNEKHAKRG